MADDIIRTRRSFTSGVIPATLEEGQLAVNVPDGLIWIGDENNSPVEVGLGDDGSFVKISGDTMTGMLVAEDGIRIENSEIQIGNVSLGILRGARLHSDTILDGYTILSREDELNSSGQDGDQGVVVDWSGKNIFFGPFNDAYSLSRVGDIICTGNVSSSLPAINATHLMRKIEVDNVLDNKEDSLGSPTISGQVLSSTSAGVRSWIDVSSSVAWGTITGTISDQTDLQDILNGKAEVVHAHVESDITDLDKYTRGQVDAFLNGKADINHDHDGDYDFLGAASAVQNNLDTHTEDTLNPHSVQFSQTNPPATFPPSAHTHLEADITDLDKYTQSEVDSLIAGIPGQEYPSSSLQSVDFTVDAADGFDHYYAIDSVGVTVTIPLGLPVNHRFIVTLQSDSLIGVTGGVSTWLPEGKVLAPFGANAVVGFIVTATDSIDVFGDLADE